MGAKETKSKITNSTVYVKYNPTLVDYVDLKFNQPYKTLLKIEIIRCKFILLWNDLIRKTGTITLKDVKFYYILQSILLNLGVLLNEKLSAINLSAEDPYIGFEPNVNVTTEMLKIIDAFRKLLIFVRENEKQIFELDDEINLDVIDVEDLVRNPDDVLIKHNVAPIKILSLKTKMRQNLVCLKQGQLVIAAIKAIVEDIRRSIPDFIHKFYRGEEMRKIEIMVSEAKSKNIVSPARLVYKYINQPKLLSFDDHHDAIDDDIKCEREAREILAAYYADEDAGRAIIYPSKTEPCVTNIVQTFSRERNDQAALRHQNYSLTEPNRAGFLQQEIPLDFTNRTVEPRSGTLVREIGLEGNRSYLEPRPEIQREQQEIKHRIQEARMISDSNKRKEIAAAEISKSARIERSEDFRREVDAIEKRLVGGDVRCVSETVKVDSIRKKKKKLRMLKPKKNKSENKENIDANRPREEINIIDSSKAEHEERNVPTIDDYIPQKQAFKNSKIKDIKVISNSNEMYSGTDEFRAEEKLNHTNNTLDIYNLYLKDIYINPANTKTVIKSMLEIPEENLIVTGSDSGEVRIFQFNKSILQKKTEISSINQEQNFSPCLKLLHEIKVFDSPIKSMVFMPSREFSSYFSAKNFYGKSSENLKLKYFLVAACMDGHMSLVDLRNFNEEKIYPKEFTNFEEPLVLLKEIKDKDVKEMQDDIVIETVVEVNDEEEKNERPKIQAEEKLGQIKNDINNNNYNNNNRDDKIKIYIDNIEQIDYNNKNDKDFLNQIKTITQSYVEHVLPDLEPSSADAKSQNNLASEASESNQNQNQLNFSSKINTVNLPIYSMVYIPNRKTVLFSQGTDIFQFNNYIQMKQNNIKNKKSKNLNLNQNESEAFKVQKTKIQLLIPNAHNDEINLLYFIKDKNILVSCSKDNRILLWDFSDSEKSNNFSSIGELAGSTSRIYSLCSGYIEGVWHIASLSKEGIVNFWNLENKEKSKTITFPFTLKSIQFSGYENIFIIVKKANGFILFDAFEDQFKEYCNMDRLNKQLVSATEKNAEHVRKVELLSENVPVAREASEKLNKLEEAAAIGNYKLNIHPNKKIENFDFQKLNLLSLRLMSKYTCGILVSNEGGNVENETDVYFAIFANKLGNLDVWANFDDDDLI